MLEVEVYKNVKLSFEDRKKFKDQAFNYLSQNITALDDAVEKNKKFMEDAAKELKQSIHKIKPGYFVKLTDALSYTSRLQKASASVVPWLRANYPERFKK